MASDASPRRVSSVGAAASAVTRRRHHHADARRQLRARPLRRRRVGSGPPGSGPPSDRRGRRTRRTGRPPRTRRRRTGPRCRTGDGPSDRRVAASCSSVVTDVVAVQLVDLAEAVEGHDEHGQRRAVLVGTWTIGLVEALFEHGAVGQPGELVPSRAARRRAAPETAGWHRDPCPGRADETRRAASARPAPRDVVDQLSTPIPARSRRSRSTRWSATTSPTPGVAHVRRAALPQADLQTHDARAFSTDVRGTPLTILGVVPGASRTRLGHLGIDLHRRCWMCTDSGPMCRRDSSRDRPPCPHPGRSRSPRRASLRVSLGLPRVLAVSPRASSSSRRVPWVPGADRPQFDPDAGDPCGRRRGPADQPGPDTAPRWVRLSRGPAAMPKPWCVEPRRTPRVLLRRTARRGHIRPGRGSSPSWP